MSFKAFLPFRTKIPIIELLKKLPVEINSAISKSTLQRHHRNDVILNGQFFTDILRFNKIFKNQKCIFVLILLNNYNLLNLNFLVGIKEYIN
ncbi:hypothetical protein BpHYR1_030597 [Brachionus plicatilis]|uniref:Uncharacterized protein n=1 Tax=Brachionus plicatilis TaxID=10195 RepID=A0A3M7RFE3_BRAPC|nr:hypothetical protein BpHYR1_030597 [Brachionus plicatilis]